MIKMKKVSVIIPVYNCESTIIRTLESIKNQTFKNYEILIIDDGSTDLSPKIIKEYIKNDNRFEFFSQPNGGVSSARNLGLSKLSGDYVCFIDGDDWVDSDYFSNIVNDMKNFDIVFYSYRLISDNTREVFCDTQCINMSKKSFFENMHKYGIFSPICSKVFSKKVIGNIKFNEKLTRSEDADFTFKCFLNSEKYTYLRKCFYNYDVNAGNLGFNFSNNKFISKVDVYNNYEKFYEANAWNKKFVNNFFAKTYILDLVNYTIENGYNKKKYLEYKSTLDNYKKFDMKNVSKKNYFPLLIIRLNIYSIIYMMFIIIRKMDIRYKKMKIGRKN